MILLCSQHFVAIRKNSDLCLGVKLVCVSLSQNSLSCVSVFWSYLQKKPQHTTQSSSVYRLSNSYMILPDIPFLATWLIAIPSTERLYISLSCYYKFHAKTKRQKYSEVFAKGLHPQEWDFSGISSGRLDIFKLSYGPWGIYEDLHSKWGCKKMFLWA